ncbi:hypothetical protein CFE70_009007 [Pyrenophora teres f. teres 0-1]|uniref:Uncharacterized protein n=2 Tax=Pyrenophora teres f. teres TaxID=97479 RepID=E3S281_PYRTT|nr:hypothetical protein PTT_16390 [Pyrenophora teres f. teres 0-1]KAE8824623.1 hypothetical protein PTNB85_09387 [Pyrenophora teres f. teres]KAE8831940.1 hypothetical protein HRS9139_06182 [Pyrenophora teres f. teres]KAE8858224.1 hypothetical protein PTNB29_07439 [Pyrenophora teres f. teres]CAE7207398.1 hypothetical protein PTTW11_09699 [Pyrenophora teres f. teres]
MLANIPSMRFVATSILLFTSATTAAPSRTQTQCRCEIVQEAAAPAYTPSAAHWSPSSYPSPSPSAVDVCSSLAVQLAHFQHTEPELYNVYMRHGKKPVPTHVLMAGAQGSETENAVASSSSPPPPSRLQHGRIRCSAAAPKPISSDYQSSFLSLWALQIVIVVAILACIAEGIHLGIQHIRSTSTTTTTSSSPTTPIFERSNRLRLVGSEQRLLAIPTGPHITDLVASPGAEKKLRAYESTKYFVTRYTSGRKEFIAYDDDSDDESNRPVM